GSRSTDAFQPFLMVYAVSQEQPSRMRSPFRRRSAPGGPLRSTTPPGAPRGPPFGVSELVRHSSSCQRGATPCLGIESQDRRGRNPLWLNWRLIGVAFCFPQDDGT